jgi:hypothetical protein
VGDSQALLLALRRTSIDADMLAIYIAMRSDDGRETDERTNNVGYQSSYAYRCGHRCGRCLLRLVCDQPPLP